MPKKCHTQKEREQCTSENSPLLQQDAWRKCCPVASPELQITENYQQQAASEETAPYFGVAPRIHSSAPLKGQKQADDEEESSQEVDLANLLLDGELAVLSLGILEEEENDSDSNASEG